MRPGEIVLGDSDILGTERSDAAELASLLVDESSVLATVTVMPDGRLQGANPGFLRLLGIPRESVLNRDFRQLLVRPDDWDHWKRALDVGHVRVDDVVLKAPDDREVIVKGDIWAPPDSSERSGPIFAAFVDVTRIRSLESNLQHAARSEALRSIAGGVIHDFRNLLTVLVGNLSLITERVRDDPRLLDQARRARDVARRGADLTERLLSFAGERNFEPSTLDLGRVVTRLEPLLELAVGKRIRLELQVGADLPAIEASAGLLEGVIVNLVINARDAISDSGTIIVSVDSRTSDHRAWVYLTVQDDGAGIPDALQSRIFEPYFSTKTHRGGTGLGLSMVRWFAESAGGSVDLSSTEGEGTEVTILLPASSEIAEDSAVMTMPLKRLPSGQENLLVVAGDASVAKTIEDSLFMLGYSIFASSDPAEILTMVLSSDIPLVILDSSASAVLDPGRLVDAIRLSGSGSSVLVVGAIEADDPAGPDAVGILKKPFSLKDLAADVRAALDSKTLRRERTPGFSPPPEKP